MTELSPEDINKVLNDVYDRVEAVEKIVTDAGLKEVLDGNVAFQDLLRAVRQATRERRLVQAETQSSEVINAQAAERLLGIEAGIKDLLDELKLLAESTKAEILQKERSARNSSNLLQTKVSDIEVQLATAAEDIGQLVSVTKQLETKRAQLEGLLGNFGAELKRLLEDGAFRKELREIAAKEAGKADEAFVMAIAQEAIRQGLDSGLLQAGPAVQNLKPKPERKADGGD